MENIVKKLPSKTNYNTGHAIPITAKTDNYRWITLMRLVKRASWLHSARQACMSHHQIKFISMYSLVVSDGML